MGAILQPTLPLAGLERGAFSQAVMDKRDDQIYVRLPNDLKRQVKKHATAHLRNLNQTILYLIARGLHAEQFTLGDWSEDAAHDDNS